MSGKTGKGKALPKGWREVRLGEVGVIHSGGTPSTRDDSNWNGSIFWLTPSEVTKLPQKYISSTDRKITQKGLSDTTLLPEGCLIVCTRATIGDCCINTVPMTINQGFKCIQPHEVYSVTFLYYTLKSLKQQLVRLSCGNTFGEVSRKDFSNILIAVPSLPEQKTIASLLETWDTAIEKTEALIAAKEKRFKWLLKTLISDQQDNPEWRKVKLGDICAVFKGQGLSKDSISKNGKNKCILYGQLYTIYPEIIDEVVGRTNIKNGIVSKKGDILVPGSTTTKGIDLANATALLEDDVLLGGDINILRPVKNNVYDSAFLAYCLTHSKKREIVRYTQGITIVHLYGKDLKNLNLLLPGLEKQREIARSLRKSVEEINLLKKLAEKYSAQKRGLMKKLLTGQWGVRSQYNIMAKNKPKRKYTEKTLKILFGSSSVCAFPGCTTPIIDLGTGRDKDFVAAQICHIHAISPDGPRWKAGLTEEYLNSPENLILLCRNHHAKVDCRDSKYSAEVLKRWRQDQINGSKFVIAGNFDSSFVDEKIEDETDLLCKSRFFAEYEKIPSTIKLAERLVNGDFSSGTNGVKCKSLAWCARLLARAKELDKARDYLEFAEELGTCPEISIAEAFMASQEDGKDFALGILGRINSPISRSAALMIVAYHDGSQKAVSWMEDAGIDITDLDSDGKYLLLMCQLELSGWEAAEKSISALANEDFIDSPILYYAAAMAHLLCAVPGELRHDLLNGLPFNLADFPLASNQRALKNRLLAHHNFIKAKEAAQQLNCFHAEAMNDEYALWLELRDPSESDQGRERLEDKLRDYKSNLRLVRFGFQFGINLDLEAVEQEIKRQIVLNGGITYDAALARFSIALEQETPEDVAKYIARYYDELVCHLNKEMVQSVWIGTLAHAGLLDEANESLDMLAREKGLSNDEKAHLQKIITEAGDTAPVKSRKEQFKKTDSLGDLARLVGELEAKNDWSGVCEYGEILFARTSALLDAERLARALNNAQKSKRLLEFLKSNETLVAQSKTLQIIFCWSLYYEGMLLKAYSELGKLDSDWNNPYYRELQIVLAISMGDWHFLSGFVANELVEKDNRSAQELIYAAKLAVHLDLLPAKELIFAAADKANNDANVFAEAYFLASKTGLENSAEVSQWINKAAELSGESGPIKKMALEDILDQQPEWRRQESEIQKMLISGELPMLTAVRCLNKSLIHLMTFPALANLAVSDPRFRSNIPAYSGKRQPVSLNTDRKIVVDVTTLLTLSLLDILDDALDAFDTVYISHATLRWLFREKQQVAFHQPSRIKNAHRVRDLLSAGALEEISPSTAPNSDLSHQIGESLALLIAEAEKGESEGSSQRIVVTTFPVSQVGSLMKEEVDLTSHDAVLSSCQSVVKKLRGKGQITANEEGKAHAYLRLHEKPWPNQPEITEGAILYLDDLVVNYFLHLGILDKLHAAGFKPIISSREALGTDKLISYENISGKVKDIIEHIRLAIHSRIGSGKVKVGRIIPNQSSRSEVFEYPTIDIFAMSEYCDAIIVDDRFINQHPEIIDNSTSDVGHMRVFSSLDLIDALVTAGLKTSEERLEYRTRLRRAGYFFVPVTEDELKTYLDASAVEGGKVIETAELKAVRENILCVRMSDWLQLPQEAIWLGELLMVFIRTLQDLWKADADFSNARARSNWIIDQVDLRGWAHSFDKENRDNIARAGFGEYLQMLIKLPTEVPQEVMNEYWSWVEEKVFIPVKEECPDLYSRIVKWQREQIARISDMNLSQEEQSDE